MAALEILGVSLLGTHEKLWGAHIDTPNQGAGAESPVLPVAGWVVGRLQPVAVEVMHGAQGRRRPLRATPLGVSRPDVALAYPHVSQAKNAGFSTSVDVRNLEPQFSLLVRALLDDGGRAPIATIRGQHSFSGTGQPLPERSEERPAAHEEPRMPGAPSVREDVRQLILGAASSNGGVDIVTHALGSESEAPAADAGLGRTLSDRAHALNRLALEGKKVLDLGAGLGDMSRVARARGASVVDGFEQDAGLVRLARLVNAYNKVTRVSFYQRDLALPETYQEHYDVVLAFSLLADNRSLLGTIAGITDGVLVTELPDSDRDSRSAAFDAVKQSFPACELLVPSEQATPNAVSGGLLVCGRSEAALRSALREPAGADGGDQ